MNVTVSIGGEFKREFKRLRKKYKSLVQDYESFIESLKSNPNIGVDLGNGIRKVRMTISSKGKGKSCGARVITYNVLVSVAPDEVLNITLLTIYDKSEIESVSDAYIKSLLESDNK